MPQTRTDYTGEGLLEADLGPTPFQQARAWVEEAVARSQVDPGIVEPMSLSVATVDAEGRPNVRTVLMRFFDPRGPGFVTSVGSAKAHEVSANPGIAAALTWPGMFRAIRFRGVAERIESDEVDAYFRSRPWGSRISAWASAQSEPVASRAELEAAYRTYAARWPEHGAPDDVPVPDSWGGYRVLADAVEFWAGRRDRLHDRLVFTKVADGSLDDPAAWRLSRLQP